MTLPHNERLVLQFAKILGHDVWDGWRTFCLNYPDRSPVKSHDGNRVCYDFRAFLADLDLVMGEAQHFMVRHNIYQWMLIPSNNGYRFRITLPSNIVVSGFGTTMQLAVMQACVKLYHHMRRKEEDELYVEPLYMD